MVAAGDRVLASVSGGSDSTALLLALIGLGADVTAAHYDHALRPGSGADAEHVSALCGRLGVPLVRGRRTVPLGKGSPEEACRRLRYAFLEDARARVGAQVIATGHTADDVAEGVLLHLQRGCGLAGARGVPARTGRVVRPLLGARREELRSLLLSAGIGWVDDPTNGDARQPRARVRSDLLPRLERDRPGITQRLIGAAETARRLHDRLGTEASQLHSGPRARPAPVRAATPAVRAEALRRLYAAAGGQEPGLGRVHLVAMERLVSNLRTGASLDLPGGYVFRVGREWIEVVPRSAADRRAGSAAPAAAEPIARECPGCDTPSAVHLAPGTVFRVGRRSPGLRLRRPGGHTRKLQDLLVDAHVPRWARDDLPLVFSGDRLVWVPGVAGDPEVCVPTSLAGLHIEFESGGRKEGAW